MWDVYPCSICLDECVMCTYVQYVWINVGCVPMFNMFRLDECGMCTYVQYV